MPDLVFTDSVSLRVSGIYEDDMPQTFITKRSCSQLHCLFKPLYLWIKIVPTFLLFTYFSPEGRVEQFESKGMRCQWKKCQKPKAKRSRNKGDKPVISDSNMKSRCSDSHEIQHNCMNRQTDTANCHDILDRHTDEQTDTVKCQYVNKSVKHVSKDYKSYAII